MERSSWWYHLIYIWKVKLNRIAFDFTILLCLQIPSSQETPFTKTILLLSKKGDVAILRGFLYSFARVNFAKSLLSKYFTINYKSCWKNFLAFSIRESFKQIALIKVHNVKFNLQVVLSITFIRLKTSRVLIKTKFLWFCHLLHS